ncbi:MAG: DUF4394 domain-containing protein [Blastocatellia bacterium]
MKRTLARMSSAGGVFLDLLLGFFLLAVLFSAWQSSKSQANASKSASPIKIKSVAASREPLLPVQGTPICVITCPANITQSNDPNQCGAVVNYPAPTSAGTCGTVTCSPASGSFFPVGTTTVDCFSAVCNTIYAVAGNNIISFDPATPGSPTTPVPVTGLGMGESLIAIDFRPATGVLYGLAAAGITARVLTIDPATGATVQVGSTFGINGTGFGFDFNPTNDRLRVTSDADLNLLVNPDDGTVTIQGTLNPGDPNVVGSAYSNNFAGASVTTLFGIDSGTDMLVTQVPATGVLTNVGTLGVDTSFVVGFDISACATAYAALNEGDATGFYTINLMSGAATLVGDIGGGLAVQGIAVGPPPSCSFTITVVDTQPPSITCPANVTAVTALTCPATSASGVVNFPPPTASDNCPGVTAACVPASGSIFPVGTTTVTCTATDASGNTATCSFSVTVFDVCLQDDSDSSIKLLINSFTGEYRFLCSGIIFTGLGKVTGMACDKQLVHNPSDRRVLGKWSSAVKRGHASIQFSAGSIRCTLRDSDMTNNDCATGLVENGDK